ncbi:MAG TPA: dephospho-CoA kinase [Vicinamibacterales bacterium]|nr:dephospho-CoA kinase [Vicinamibacterales bacterium]
MSLLKVALTGGIATGKSYCLGRFGRRGVPIIDADVLAHALVRRGEPAWTAVRERFGDEVLQADGEIDRVKLGAIVFADAAARRDLESIIHPAVYRAILTWYGALADGPPYCAIADIPLLYETGHEGEFDRVIATWCPPSVQIARMTQRDALTHREAEARLAAQMPADEKAQRADFVIRTDGTFAETDAQVDAVLAKITAVARQRMERE